MKHVFTNIYDIAHMWANRVQESARNSGNFYFENETIYSYGSHFPIARHTTNQKGENATLLTILGYSHTTAKHISIVSAATSHLNVIKCAYPCGSHSDNFVFWLSQAENIAAHLLKAKKPEIYLNQLADINSEVTKYANFFDVQIPLNLVSVLEIGNKAEYNFYVSLRDERRKAEETEKLRILKIKHSEDLAKFFNYELDYLYSRIDEDYCRISENKEFVETTQRVRITVKTARLLYSLIKEGKDIKGFNCDGYTVIELNGVLKIGCHCINKDNMREIGEQLLTLKS